MSKLENAGINLVLLISVGALIWMGAMFGKQYSEPTPAYVTYSSTYNGYVVSELISNCESHEHWGDPKYRYDWSLKIEDTEVVNFRCQTPKRTATDYRERFVTEY